MKLKLKYYIINLHNESDLKEFGIEVKEGKAGTLTLTNPLQKEEIDWAGFVPIEEAKKRIAKYQLSVIERYERGNVMGNGGNIKINRFLLIKKETSPYSKNKNYLVEQYELDIKDTATSVGYSDKNGVDEQIIYFVKIYTDKYDVFGKPNELLHEPIYIIDTTGKNFVEKYKQWRKQNVREGYEDYVEKQLARIVVLTTMPQKMESGGQAEDKIDMRIRELKYNIKEANFVINSVLSQEGRHSRVSRMYVKLKKKDIAELKKIYTEHPEKEISEFNKGGQVKFSKNEYENIKHLIQNGDIIIYKAKGFTSRMIRMFGKTDFDHSAIIQIKGKKIENIELDTAGFSITPLKDEIKDTQFFVILRPKNISDKKITNAIKQTIYQFKNKKFSYKKILKIALTELRLKKYQDLNNDTPTAICTELVNYYLGLIGIKDFNEMQYILPEDFLESKKLVNIKKDYGGEIDYEDFDDWIFNKKVLETKLKMFVKLLK